MASMATYENVGSKTLTVAGKAVAPGDRFTDKDADKAGVRVELLVRAGQVRRVTGSRKPAKTARTRRSKAGK